MPTVEFYRERAEQSLREADGAALENVRERLLASHDVWVDMADRLERTMQSRADRDEEKRMAAEEVLGSIEA